MLIISVSILTNKRVLVLNKILSVPSTMDSSFFSQQMAPWRPNFPHQRLWLNHLKNSLNAQSDTWTWTDSSLPAHCDFFPPQFPRFLNFFNGIHFASTSYCSSASAYYPTCDIVIALFFSTWIELSTQNTY